MAMSQEPLRVSDIKKYLETQDDFAFELKVLKLLRSRAIKAHHSGSYMDPILGKPRQFDIRAELREGPYEARFAIECKNLSVGNPLLIVRTPRTSAEAFIDIRFVSSRSSYQSVKRRHAIESPYRALEHVGRTFSQVSRWVDLGKPSKPGAPLAPDEIRGGDSEAIYQKMTQCLASADELVQQHLAPFGDQNGWATIRAILVVPERCLWVADYDETGKLLRQPHRAERCEVFVGSKYFIKTDLRNFTISHVDVMTWKGLFDWTLEHFQHGEALKNLILPGGH